VATLALLLLSRSGLGAPYHYTLGFTVDAVLVAVFIVQMLQLHGSALWSWLETPVARYLGVLSYPLYLWHQWGLGAGHHVRVAGLWGEFAAGMGLSILLASGSYYVIERPFLALKARLAAPGRRSGREQLVTAGYVSRGLVLVLAAIGTIAALGAFATRRLTRHRAAAVTLSPAILTVPAGERRRLWATVADPDGRPLPGRVVTWASSNASVAAASDSGVITGLTPGTATITATSTGRSATAAVTVTAPAGDSGLAFQSDWSAATGSSRNAVSDGGRWLNYWEFNHDTDVQLLSVVAGGPGGRNALKVLQRGPTFAANLQQDGVVPPSTDYYVRFYMRNDDTSPAGDHIVTGDTWKYTSLIYMRKFGGNDGWRYVIGLYGCGYTYPVGYFGPTVRLTNGAWYRFEYHVHFVDATHAQVHPRVYDASGKLLLSDADFHQSDPGQASWNDRSDWTLASYYAAGHSFCVSPQWLTSFGLGNNGQDGAVDTGRPWYFAGVAIRTDHWAGP
ncbi:MAG TPA: Ig-like domain-containing protein, partial [Gemmatimonadales bacterium]